MRNVLGYVFSDLIYTVFIRLNAAAFITFFMIRVRRLLTNQLLFVNNTRVADHYNFKKNTETCFSASLKSHLLYCSQFHNLHVCITAIHKVNKNFKSGMLSRHQNWYIQKDLCLVRSKFPTAIEAMITMCFLSLLFE